MGKRITIGNLRCDDKFLEVGCTRCWHVRYVDASTLSLHGNLAVTEAYKRMKCSKCGEKAGYSRLDARVNIVKAEYGDYNSETLRPRG